MSYAKQLRNEAYRRIAGTNYKKEVVKIEGRIKRETAAAICFNFENTDMWFPLSQVNSIHRTFSAINGTLDSIVITEWIARQKNITTASLAD